MDTAQDVEKTWSHKELLFSETRTTLSYTRTMMSAERTLLSFSGTGLSLLAGGVGLVKYVDHPGLQILGYLLIPIGIFVWIRGIINYVNVRRLMKKVGHFLESQGLYVPGVFIGGSGKFEEDIKGSLASSSRKR